MTTTHPLDITTEHRALETLDRLLEHKPCETYFSITSDETVLQFAERIAENQKELGGELRVIYSEEIASEPTLRRVASFGFPIRSIKRHIGLRVTVDDAVALVNDRLVRAEPDARLVATALRRTWQAAELAHESERQAAPDRADEAIALLATGLTDTAVARHLGVSVRTVRSDVAAMMQRMAANSRFQAGVRAAQLGLV